MMQAISPVAASPHREKFILSQTGKVKQVIQNKLLQLHLQAVPACNSTMLECAVKLCFYYLAYRPVARSADALRAAESHDQAVYLTAPQQLCLEECERPLLQRSNVVDRCGKSAYDTQRFSSPRI